MFSKKEATWSFSQEISFFHYNFLKGENSIIYAPIEYIGGNNEIININQSPKKNFIKIDEENRRFIIELDKNLTTLKFNVNGELKNKCKGEWNVHLTDEEVDKLMPKEDIKCKDQLKKIAQKIINDFDKEHKNSDFEFLDYMKIGFWVHKNIKYDMNYSGKKMSAMEIYNLTKGVCHHFTLLSNALLYSLGYKVLYVTCLCCQKNQKMNRFDLHAHSLIKIGNKWYPFDSTWCILTGKLHVGHVFLKYGSSLYCEYDKKDFIIPYMDDNCQFIK